MKKYLVLLALIALASCAKEEALSPADGRYTLTVNASKEPLSKALNLSGSTLSASWQQGEKVDVYKGEDKIGELTAQSTASNTRLSGELTVAPSANDVLTLKFLGPSYASQDGTLAYIAANCDYATASVTVKSIAGGNVTIEESSATFTNQQAIVKFTLLDIATGHPAINAAQLTVTAGATTITVTPSSATSELFVALPGISSQTVSLTANVAGKLYTYSKNTVSFSDGQYYEISVKMSNSGALSGKFSINGSGGKVRFSQGNLQATYDGSSWTWGFATNQWGYIGYAEGNTKVSGTAPFVSGYSGTSTTVDLFGWVGSSSKFTGAAQYGISNSTTTNDANGYGKNASEALKSDWGNTIGSGWRTLSIAEWQYLFNTRTSGSTVNGTSNARYSHATINTDGTGVNGMILFPDGVTIADSEATSWGTINDSSAWGTQCTTAQWTALASKGCVFLPAAGYRNGTSVFFASSYGYYRSSSPNTSNVDKACSVIFGSANLNPSNSSNSRCYGYSVRLVRPVE